MAFGSDDNNSRPYPKKVFEFQIPIGWLEVPLMRCLSLMFTMLVLTASTVHADLAPSRPIIPPVPKDSPVPLILAGVAVATGVGLLGLWLTKKGRSKDSQDS